MNKFLIAAFLCVGLVSASDDGQYRGEGLLESQDFGQYNQGYGAPLAVVPYAYHGVYAYGGAPIGADGRVVDTPEVVAAKASHFAAKAAAGGHEAYSAYAPLAYSAYAPVYGVYGGAPIGLDGRVVDTPEVAHAKAAHFAAKAAAGSPY